MPKPNPRLQLVMRLRSELLGPRGGPEETLPPSTDPREEYTTGVLDSPDLPPEPELALDQLEAALTGEMVEAEIDDEEGPDPLLLAADFAASVDPRRLPSSIGISFLLEDSANAALELCVSGGRYRKGSTGWSRCSCAWVLPALAKEQWNQEFRNEELGLRVVLRSRLVADDSVRVSVYLVNQSGWRGQSRERASGFLYQPQIRVLLGSGARLRGMHERLFTAAAREEEKLQLLYRNAPVMARGHLCGAVWKAIDPEQLPDAVFGWVDGKPEYERFRHCDLRTEMLPLYAVATPLTHWRQEYGEEPERAAERLADLGPAALAETLERLPNAYQSWVQEREEELSQLPERYQRVADQHLQLCREALRRMRAGIELLKMGGDEYLAFCFANRAVHVQAAWPDQPPLVWRPFQLGFLLQCLCGLADPTSEDREICDLLWFPTGGGKTEAYLGLTAFTLALRRLRHHGYDGVGVVSRYTLRLLSIQQFRRAIKLITACEMLRVHRIGTLRGWRPRGAAVERDWLWGAHRFSAGLWLGGAVTPNRLDSLPYPINLPGAFDILTTGKGESEPAQVTECPACNAVLAFPADNEDEQGQVWTLHLRVSGLDQEPEADDLGTEYIQVHSVKVRRLTAGVHQLELRLSAKTGALSSAAVDGWWSYRRSQFGQDCRELCARASRPGYFINTVVRRKNAKPFQYSIELFCPNPECPTASFPWSEKLPVTLNGEVDAFQPVHPAVCQGADPTVARQCPIPALTVDEQIYAWPPSLLISTVDKFARLAFEPRAGALFGNVEYYHAHYGYYRTGCFRQDGSSRDDHPPRAALRVPVAGLPCPELVIQDELHLIDGPLGSMVGLYETAIQALCKPDCRLKYVASTATVREASDQVQALFARELRQFPPPSLDARDSFFAVIPEGDVLQEKGAGRLYMGYCAPGRGALTPQVRVWAVLLQAAQELRQMGLSEEELDPYWSPVGYYTAIRNLAAAGGLWRQMIPLRLRYLSPEGFREISMPLELSSRISSSRLPGLLNRLGQTLPNAVDGVLTTSMFGTGVDVSRLSLMLVQGQPKTTSSYIQATGRVGRQSPGLIVTNLPAANPRSLDHYEFFTGYHHQLYRGVEPVTVYPFAPRARERAIGPLCVALLRQWRDVDPSWRDREIGARLILDRWGAPELRQLREVFMERGAAQPELRRPSEEALLEEVEKALVAWHDVAVRQSSELQFEEYTLTKEPRSPVVLGDPQHIAANLSVVYPNAPQSLRDIEPTMGLKI